MVPVDRISRVNQTPARISSDYILYGMIAVRCWLQTCQFSLFQAMSQNRHS